MTLKLLAPAKLNLFLRITGRRDDGYHELQTLFQLLDYGDDLSFELRSDKTIAFAVDTDSGQTTSTTTEQLEPPFNPQQFSHNNLITRAAQSLQEYSCCSLGADIRLVKRLPIGGGLGGGSSDAATTLIALNKLWKLNYSRQTLARIGLQLGADIPVFIHGHTAWAEGIGERLSAVDMDSRWYLVIMPPCSVSTTEIFNDQQLTRNSPPITIRAFREHGAGNDCQEVVEKRYPEVKNVRLWLDNVWLDNEGLQGNRLSNCVPAQMTGTGACVFASFTDQAQAAAVLVKLPEQWQGFIARGVNTSPAYPE